MRKQMWIAKARAEEPERAGRNSWPYDLGNLGRSGDLLYWFWRFCHGLLVTRWSLIGPDSSPPFLPAV